jgi:hypothetical protein
LENIEMTPTFYETKRACACFLLCAATVFGGTGIRQAWEKTSTIHEILPAIPAITVPTLPAPRLIREPEFTLGLSNTLFWPADSIEASLTAEGWNLQYYEIMAQYTFQDSLFRLYSPVDPGTGSVTTDPLAEGPAIEYRLRYFAQGRSGDYACSYWSEPQVSIQDAHAPVLERWDIVRLRRAVPIAWVIGKTLTFRVTASDLPAGKVMEIIVHEKSETADDTVIFDIVPPRLQVDTMFSSYSLRTEEHKSVTLTLWVKDVSGQSSFPVILTLFWMSEEENRMFSFPNPFNPSRQEIAVIQVPSSELQTAKVFDPFGNCVRILRKGDAANAFFEWDGRNERGDLVANGGYLCVAEGREKLYCKIAVLR